MSSLPTFIEQVKSLAGMYGYSLIGVMIDAKDYERVKVEAESLVGQPIGGNCFWLYDICIQPGRRIGPPWMKVVQSPNIVCSQCGLRIGVVRMYNDDYIVVACPRCGMYDVPRKSGE